MYIWLYTLTSHLTEETTGQNDYFYMLSVGPPFEYVIPGYDLLVVDLREMRVQGYDYEGQLKLILGCLCSR